MKCYILMIYMPLETVVSGIHVDCTWVLASNMSRSWHLSENYPLNFTWSIYILVMLLLDAVGMQIMVQKSFVPRSPEGDTCR